MKKIIQDYSQRPKGFFKRIFITFLFGYMPFAIGHAILNIAGIVPVNFNDQEIYGVKGFFVILCFSPFIVLMLTIMFWVCFMFGNLILKVLNKILYA